MQVFDHDRLISLMLGLHRESFPWQAAVERCGLEAWGCQDLDLVQYINNLCFSRV